MRRPSIRSLAGGAAGIAAGVTGGVALTSVSAAAPPVRPVDPPAFVDATHVPPLLTVPGEPITLRYAIVCPPRDDGLPCDGAGTVYLRTGSSGRFRAYPLTRRDESGDGRYALAVPTGVAEAPAGFSYYAVLRDERSGASITLPRGGAAAPQVSRPLDGAAAVALGRHAFGAARAPDARAATAGWGSG